MKNKIETAIRECAAKPISSKYNLAQYQKGGKRFDEKVKAIKHKTICEDIVTFADQHKEIPMYFILSVGVAKGAYKMSEFEKGYKTFNPEKVLQVYDFGQMYNQYNGIGKRKMSDVTIRLMMCFWERVSHNKEVFAEHLNKSEVLGKACGERGNYKGLCRNLGINTLESETLAA